MRLPLSSRGCKAVVVIILKWFSLVGSDQNDQQYKKINLYLFFIFNQRRCKPLCIIEASAQ
jgi:hypothetical protein